MHDSPLSLAPLYLPASQIVHEVRPVADVNLPAAHASHEVDAFLLV